MKTKKNAGGKDKEMSITGAPVFKGNVKLKHVQLLMPAQ